MLQINFLEKKSHFLTQNSVFCYCVFHKLSSFRSVYVPTQAVNVTNGMCDLSGLRTDHFSYSKSQTAYSSIMAVNLDTSHALQQQH
jgi:hypothetical protein